MSAKHASSPHLSWAEWARYRTPETDMAWYKKLVIIKRTRIFRYSHKKASIASTVPVTKTALTQSTKITCLHTTVRRKSIHSIDLRTSLFTKMLESFARGTAVRLHVNNSLVVENTLPGRQHSSNHRMSQPFLRHKVKVGVCRTRAFQ